MLAQSARARGAFRFTIGELRCGGRLRFQRTRVVGMWVSRALHPTSHGSPMPSFGDASWRNPPGARPRAWVRAPDIHRTGGRGTLPSRACRLRNSAPLPQTLPPRSRNRSSSDKNKFHRTRWNECSRFARARQPRTGGRSAPRFPYSASTLMTPPSAPRPWLGPRGQLRRADAPIAKPLSTPAQVRAKHREPNQTKHDHPYFP